MAKKKLFKFVSTKKAATPKSATTRAPKLKEEEDIPPFLVRGRPAGSKDEYWCSLALDKISKDTGVQWDYQVPVNGGRHGRGGNVIDFLVYTAGQYTALDPMGRVWHTGSREDRFQMQRVCRRKGWKLIAWFTDETPTKESYYNYLKPKIR